MQFKSEEAMDNFDKLFSLGDELEHESTNESYIEDIGPKINTNSLLR